jgi:hypothetical protein
MSISFLLYQLLKVNLSLASPTSAGLVEYVVLLSHLAGMSCALPKMQHPVFVVFPCRTGHSSLTIAD